MKKVESYTVPDIKQEVRLSDFLPGKLETITSKKGIKKAIINGLVKINGELGHTADYIRGGEFIELYQVKPKNKPEINLDLDVLYEDEYLAIIHKPAGIIVSGNQKWTIENALDSNLKNSDQIDVLPYPEPIHRLDHPTSGALLIGKTRLAVTALNKLFEERKIEKIYHAVTIGTMSEEGIINSEIKGKSANTNYKVLNKTKSEIYGFLNLVQLKPITGRRHQLRIHMVELGNPILGDQKYGKEGMILKGKGLYLHATALNFDHPIKGERVSITIPLPQKFLKIFPTKTQKEE